MWAQDPEALIVMTLEVARGEARLFDEVLDWMSLNERLLSQRRMRSMCIDEQDTALVTATSAWLARQRAGKRFEEPPVGRAQLDELFHGAGPIPVLDPSFASAGLARGKLERTGRSVAPDLSLPINFALRLRAILGVGIRAEAIRIMLGTQAQLMTAQAIARSSTYSKRNVHDALASLSEARVLESVRVSGELRYSIDPMIWGTLLGYDAGRLPRHREWGTMFAVMRRILRWSEESARRHLSDYLSASQARQLLDELRPQLAYAGMTTSAPRDAAGAPAALERTVAGALEALAA